MLYVFKINEMLPYHLKVLVLICHLWNTHIIVVQTLCVKMLTVSNWALICDFLLISSEKKETYPTEAALVYKRHTSNLISVYIFVDTKTWRYSKQKLILEARNCLFAYFNHCETTESWSHKNVTTINWKILSIVLKNTFLER